MGIEQSLYKNDFAGSVVIMKPLVRQNSLTGGLTGKQACHVSARCDYVVDDMVIDLKTCGEGGASPDKFTKTIVNLHYHLQAAHYLQGTGAKRFIFIAVEKVFPYSVGIYQLSQSLLTKAMNSKSRHFKKYLKQLQQKQWRGYTNACPDGIQTLTPPKWI